MARKKKLPKDVTTSNRLGLPGPSGNVKTVYVNTGTFSLWKEFSTNPDIAERKIDKEIKVLTKEKHSPRGLNKQQLTKRLSFLVEAKTQLADVLSYYNYGSELIIPKVKKNHADGYVFPGGAHIDPDMSRKVKAGLF